MWFSNEYMFGQAPVKAESELSSEARLWGASSGGGALGARKTPAKRTGVRI